VPSGGEDRASPPIRLWHAKARAELAEMLSGSSLYSMGAGGFSTVPAMPNMVRLKPPANANSRQNARAAQIYVTRPLPSKQQIQRQFGTI
jgi:hypothetical protein